ncbi:hypothetical protein [Clostridium beijerinckii]|uniref:Phage protein n=1 Tax=Clostridium beijerinckii TaxID=1520 RepID=A0AAX0B4N0_CLOBE|nr:hypothetical protein [Clostridium beijerinckii]NRT90037.1 hypothetical protein [Clostridium beijerinckii]NYC69568.1 hypothetical protein [Clostridium beijerinckii]
MRAPGDLFIWKENNEWWDIDEETHQFVLTDKAPEEAKKSFEKYLKHLEKRKKLKEG